MKKIFLQIALAAGLFTSFAFTGNSICSTNDFFVKGTSSKMGYYKADGTQTGTGTSSVTDVTTSGDSTIAVIATTYEDAKKKDGNHAGSMRMICLNDKLIMDMSGMLNAAQMPAGNDMKVVMKGNFIPYKSSYTAGEKLEDINMTMEMYNNGSLMITSDIHITDRKVEAVEDRTTPAGTFHCYKISSVSSSTSKMGSMTLPGQKPMKSIEWFCPKSGMVRIESYKDDKLFSYNELLELKKP